MDEPQTRIYEFGDFRVDAAKRLLLKGVGETVPLMPKAFDTLLYLTEHHGKVIGKAELMSAVWPDTIVEENNLTQNISVLRRVLGEKHGENRFIVTVPGRGYKFVAEVRRRDGAERPEPTALTGGLPRGPEVRIAAGNERTTKRGPAGRWWPGALVIAGVLGLSLGLYLWRGDTKPAAGTPIKTMAVLPFKPVVAEKRDEALELGMADTLISKLGGGGEDITVRPFSAVRRYGSLEQDSLAAGRELGVEAVLEGSIQTSGERIRISARLSRVADGKQLWAEQFDEKFTDIFDVQDSISERVAAALKIRLGGNERKRDTGNVEAYQLYMKGRYHALNLTRAETDKGIAYFQQAIQIDPNYARPYIGLAEAYQAMALTSGVPSAEVLPKAKAAALRAVELDETLPEAHAALGYTIFWHEWDWRAAEKEYRRALELDPNCAEAHFGYAHLLSNTARHEQALAEIKRARELDPLSLRTGALEGLMLFFAGRNDEALDRLQKTIELNPNFWLSHLFVSRVYTEKGMHAEAIAATKRAGELTGNSQSDAYRAYALTRAGEIEKARTLLDELLKLSTERYVPPYNIALVHNGLGERNEALAWLEKGYEQRDVRMVFLKVEPQWNNLRDDTHFQELLRRVGL